MTLRKPVVLVGGQKRLIRSGETLALPPSVTGGASVNIPHGAAPTAPVDGDMWSTTDGLYVRIDGVTIGPLGAASANQKTQPLTFIFDGGGSAVPNSSEDFVYVPYDCVITGYVIFGDQVGDATFDVQVDVLANMPPTGADSIVAAAPPVVATAQTHTSTTLTGWATTINSGDIVRVVTSGIANFQKLRFLLITSKT